MAILTTKDVAGFRSQLKWLLGRKHVGVSDDEILADMRTRFNRMRRDGVEMTEGFEKGIEKLALQIHHGNFKLYSQVTTGTLGARRRKNPTRRRVKTYRLAPATAIRQMRDAIHKTNWGPDLTSVLTDIARQASNHPTGVALDKLRQVKRILKGDVGSDELQQVADIIEWQDPISRTGNPRRRVAKSKWRLGQRVRLRFRGRWSAPGRITSLGWQHMGIRLSDGGGADVPWSDVRKGDVKLMGAPRKKRAKRPKRAKRRPNETLGEAITDAWTRRDAEKMGRLDAYFRKKGWRQTDIVMFLQDALRKRGIHESNRNWPERRDYDALMYELES